MAFTIMLARKGFAADGADEWPLIRMCAEMASEVVGASEAFRAEVTLEGSGVFLDALLGAGGGWTGRIRQLKDVIPVWNRRS